ncbi:MAG: hypothetical protein WD226_04890 [Planctomycetota bacterium]
MNTQHPVRIPALLALIALAACGDVDERETASIGGYAPVAAAARSSWSPSGPLAAPDEARPTGPAPTPPQTRAPERKSAQGFQRVALRDAGLNGMTSHEFQIPAGWRHQGGVVWTPEQQFTFVNLDLAISADDGREIRYQPSCIFTHSMGGGVEQFLPRLGQITDGVIAMPPPATPAEFATQFALPRVRPGARGIQLVSERQLEEVVAKWQQSMASALQIERQQNAMQREMGLGGGRQTQIFAPHVRVAYTENGQAFEEDIAYVFVISTASTDMGMGPMTTWDWSVYDVRSQRAPAGQLDENVDLFAQVFQSMRPAPGWQQEIQRIAANGNAQRNDHARKMHAIHMRGARDRAAINTNNTNNTSDDWLDSSMASWRRRQDSSDRGQHAFNNSIHGVDDYSMPDGTTRSLDAGYDHVYTDGWDNYIHTDDAFFDPNVGSSTQWHEARPVTPTGGAANW